MTLLDSILLRDVKCFSYSSFEEKSNTMWSAVMATYRGVTSASNAPARVYLKYSAGGMGLQIITIDAWYSYHQRGSSFRVWQGADNRSCINASQVGISAPKCGGCGFILDLIG